MKLSVGAGMQRPAWIPKSSKSSPSYVIIFDTTEDDDLVDFARMLGVRPVTVREWLKQLPEHHHLLAATRGQGRRVYVSRVVIRKKSGEEDRGRPKHAKRRNDVSPPS
jgi:predicted ArsR family transcriptional regulator